MNTRIVTTLAVFIVFCLATETGLADEGTAQTRRFALVVGANDGGQDRVLLQYADTDAIAIAKVLTDLGGVEKSDELLLVDANSAKLVGAIEKMRELLEAGRSNNGRVEFLFYYSGHSDERGLLLGGTRFPYRELRSKIDSLRADVKIALLDSCSSGAMTRLKGGRRVQPFLIDESAKVEGHAFLTSSSADESAQESDRIGGSFFTYYLVSGLRGAADKSHDGRVTLNEAYEFAFHETLAQTETTRGGPQHAAYDIQLTGSGDLVLTDVNGGPSTLMIEASLRGRFTIRNSGGKLVAELSKLTDKPVELGLDPGKYTIILEEKTTLSRATVVLTRGERSVVDGASLTEIDREDAVARGDIPALSVLRNGDATEEEVEHVAFRAQLVPGLGSDGFSGGNTSANVSLSLIAGYGHSVEGVEVGLAANVLKGDLTGGQLTSGVNVVLGDVTGTQVAAGGNFVAGASHGAQVSSGVNVALGPVTGAQISAGGNFAPHTVGAQVSPLNIGRTVTGAQVGVGNMGVNLTGTQSGVLNISRNIKGGQVGVLNIAENSTGTQFGVLNIARTSDAPIGILSFVLDGIHHLEFSASDLHPTNVALKLGGTWTYSYFAGGISPFEDDPRWSASVGLGVHVPVRDTFYADFDLSTGQIQPNTSSYVDGNFFNSARLTIGSEIMPHMAVFAGASFNVAFVRDDELSFGPASFGEREVEGFTMTMWPGAFGGVRLDI